MLEDDPVVAAYRDAVLWHGVVVRLTPAETATVCERVLMSDADDDVRTMVGCGLFVVDDEGWALLAIPKIKERVKSVTAALRSSGLKGAADKIVRAARRQR